tara:strand:- start:83 stop:364 length:282 start_codon:yes stop_codon:yes gene_type:complete
MKLTKSKLQQIIKEEISEIAEPSYKFAPKATPERGMKMDLDSATRRVKTLERDRDVAHEGIREFLASDGGEKAKQRLYGYLPESAELEDTSKI